MHPQQQYPPMPQYPAQPGAQYPPMPQYPAQPGYSAPYGQPAAPPPVQVPAGTLDGFFSQPSAGGGPAWKFMDANRQPQVGKKCVGIVARPITNGDIRPQVNPQNGQPQTYKDGRPKYVMVVPMQVQPDQEFPEGVASWWVKGQARDELVRAMAEAGAPEGPPEAGAAISVELVAVRPIPGFNPQFLYRITYQRPANAAPVVPAAEPASAPVAAPATAAPAAAAPAVAGGLDADQQALLAKLTGG